MVKVLRTGFVLLSSALLLSVSAQQSSDTSSSDSSNGNGMSNGGCAKMDSSHMCGAMMMYFMKPSAAFQTSDGFVVISGGKIFKFDPDLNLVKTADLPIDTTGMQKLMQQMRQCPMMNKGGNGSSDTSNAGQGK